MIGSSQIVPDTKRGDRANFAGRLEARSEVIPISRNLGEGSEIMPEGGTEEVTATQLLDFLRRI